MKKIIIILVSALFLLPPAARADQVSGVAIVVNDEPITTYDIEKEKEGLSKGLDAKTPLDEAGKAQLRQVAVDSLVNKKLIEQKVKELDIKISDEEVRVAIEDVKKNNNISQEKLVSALAASGVSFDEYKKQIREQLERLRLIGMEVRSKIQISEKEIREYFDANSASFQVDEAFHARQIFFRLSPQAPSSERDKVTKLAERVSQEITKGADFAESAKKYSEDPSAKEGGDLGFLKKGDLIPEFEAVLVKLKKGETSGLVRTQSGIHIIKLEEYRQGKQRNFEAAKPEIEDLLYKKKSEDRFNDWLNDLRKNASIEMRNGR
jgi:peptidyl-prolyl cis-trans isomerase SurA